MGEARTHSTEAAAPAPGEAAPRRDVRVAVIASLTPLEELDRDPFLVDTRSQHAMCARWAADKGYVVIRQLVVHSLPHDHRALWTDIDAGHVDFFVTANERVLHRAVRSVADFFAECERRGVRLETAGLDEPVYSATMKAEVHRRLSMPTAGYDGC
ncbi:hypothetical protein GCM10010329_40540 [Streptomyces spiroverticillatus]|uniref:Uncharacterized protein n=1 Tax=Streptomyces finlayi TaxID=67296 RepID=A0A918WZ81_9ACTN|nr:hypothetical protein [Streptomyces finlayi]GHA13599.1 hypothetical protein GCM10010329_40540 [Streptomyces spiroverticillatus]GHC97850.1 hypothetical protein GCM10010334_39700 [Streptomyces finlayi]